MRQQRPREQCRNSREDDGRREITGVRVRAQAEDDLGDFRAVEPYDGENRSELDHHGEHAARIVVMEQAAGEQQMRGGGNRKKLGYPLHDPKYSSND